MQANGLPQASFHAVTLDGATEPPSHSESNFQVRDLVAPQIKHRHVGGKVAPALLVNAFKISVAEQAQLPG